jgi:peptidoglycan hydrolase CwlO-like protein
MASMGPQLRKEQVMTYDPDALRQMNEEAQLRISELSTALGNVTEQRDTLEDSLTAALREVDAYKAHINQLNATIERLRLHIQQGVEL